jgi:diadenosine tetraphosphatase ApaH/serine/threonine PP2A family protein phosphatase
VARAGLAALQTRHGLHGHTHVPVAWRSTGDWVETVGPSAEPVLHLDERPTLLNPGSVGQPRDGDPRASWALLDTAANTFAWRRVSYDIPTTQARMTDARLPRSLISRLAVGR